MLPEGHPWALQAWCSGTGFWQGLSLPSWWAPQGFPWQASRLSLAPPSTRPGTAAPRPLGSLCRSSAHYPACVMRHSITHQVLITLEGWLWEPPQIPTYPRAYLPAAAVYTCGAFTTLQSAGHSVWEPPKAAVSKQRPSRALPSPMGAPLLYLSKWPHGCVWNTQVPSPSVGASIAMSEVLPKG